MNRNIITQKDAARLITIEEKLSKLLQLINSAKLTINKYYNIISKTKLIILSCLLFSVIMLSSCNSVKSILNQHKVSSAEEQRRSLQENSSNLGTLQSCDFSLNIGKKDFDTILNPAFNAIINGKEIKHVSSYKIDKLETSTDAELINLSADFQITLDTLNAGINGSLIGTVSFTVRNDSLILFPAFKYIHISGLTYKKTRKFERKIISSFLNVVLNGFIERLNGYMVSKVAAIPLNLMDREIAPEELVSDPTTQVTLSKPLKISTPLMNTSCLIDNSGIHILGSFSKSISKVKAIGEEFKVFQKKFSDKRDNHFPELPSDKNTYMILSKNAIANLFNSALNEVSINVKYSSDNAISDRADKNIKIDLDEIHCGDVHFDCPELHVVPSCDCPINFHCPEGIFGRACRVAEAAARATWFSTVYPPCMVSRAAEEAINLGIKATCEANRLAAIGACEVAKRALIVVLTSKVSVGDIHTTVSSSCFASGSLVGLKLNNDLSGLNLSLSANMNAPIHTTFGFTPEGPVGHLVCALSFDHPYDCEATANKTLNNELVSSAFDNSTTGLLLLKFKTNPIDFTINMNPTPLNLLTRDIPTLINCPLVGIGAGLANIVKGVNDIFSDGSFGNNVVNAIMNGTYNYTLKEKTFNLPIKTVQAKLIDKQILLSPIAKPNYIGFFNSTGD